jgi:hypothetical protein
MLEHFVFHNGPRRDLECPERVKLLGTSKRTVQSQDAATPNTSHETQKREQDQIQAFSRNIGCIEFPKGSNACESRDFRLLIPRCRFAYRKSTPHSLDPSISSSSSAEEPFHCLPETGWNASRRVALHQLAPRLAAPAIPAPRKVCCHTAVQRLSCFFVFHAALVIRPQA